VSIRPQAITLDHARDALLVGDVDHEAGRLAAELLDLRDGFLDGRLVDVANGNLGAFLANLTAVACPMPWPAR
jgi:hypothetical protein